MKRRTVLKRVFKTRLVEWTKGHSSFLSASAEGTVSSAPLSFIGTVAELIRVDGCCLNPLQCLNPYPNLSLMKPTQPFLSLALLILRIYSSMHKLTATPPLPCVNTMCVCVCVQCDCCLLKLTKINSNG
ncbi:unnamed protein product [Boreogadus saida]